MEDKIVRLEVEHYENKVTLKHIPDTYYKTAEGKKNYLINLRYTFVIYYQMPPEIQIQIPTTKKLQLSDSNVILKTNDQSRLKKNIFSTYLYSIFSLNKIKYNQIKKKIEKLVSIWLIMPSIFYFREQNLTHKFRLLQLKQLTLI